MKKKIRILLFIYLLGLLSACAGISTDPGSTQKALEPATANSELNDPGQNIAQKPHRSGDRVPDGVLVSTGNENNLVFLDENGMVINEIETPGIAGIDSEDVTIAGPITTDSVFPPVVYHSWMPDQALMVNMNGQITTAKKSQYFLALAGAPGQSALAFSEVTLNEENNPHSFLYVAKPDTLESAPAFYDLVDKPFYWALKPVGIQTIDGEAQGVWYVKTAWGIGGADLIFPINRGLYFFDLTSGDNSQYMDDGRSLQGISPDLKLAASVASDSSGDISLSVTYLADNHSLQFPLDPATDRGAGWAVFSPDNHYAAWLEATGSMIADPVDFEPRVRVGDIRNGGVIRAVEGVEAAQVIRENTVTMMRPAGWLDNGTLLIEVRGKNWEDASLLRFDIGSGMLTYFSEGMFLGFGYQ